MNKWRPEGWGNSYATVPAYDKDYNSEYHAFEAGADAILTYLLGSGIISVDDLEALGKNGDEQGNTK